jgi:hypothetical protein
MSDSVLRRIAAIRTGLDHGHFITTSLHARLVSHATGSQ